MQALEIVNLTPLMEQTSGSSKIVVALIDGPVSMVNQDLWSANVQPLNGRLPAACRHSESAACVHGTFVAGILAGQRGSPAPAICPGCTFLVRSIFSEFAGGDGQVPSTARRELADAIVECVDAGARVLNLSVSLAEASPAGEQLQAALDYAARRGAIAVVAAGNQGRIGGPALTGHSWALPVVACDSWGNPISETNLSTSAARRGLSAPGEVTSMDPSGRPITSRGTSASAAIVSGTIALLWSKFPSADAGTIKFALTQSGLPRRSGIVPPLLNAWAAHQYLEAMVRQ